MSLRLLKAHRQKVFVVLCSYSNSNTLNSPPASLLLCSSLKHSQPVYSSSSRLHRCSIQFLSAGRRGSAGFAPQPAPDDRGPTPWHLLHRRPQHPFCQFLSTLGPRRLPLEPGGWRGSVRFLRHLRSWRSIEELRYR